MVMSKEPTWLEAASKTFESGVEVWMTAPELVRSIVNSGIKSSKSEYGQSVRTLRSALNIEARKGNGVFLRKDYNFNCYFALKEMVDDTNTVSLSRTPAKRAPTLSKRKQTVMPKYQSPPPSAIINGYPPSPTTPLSTPQIVPTPGTPIIEINPDVGHRQKEELSGFCLPSPLTSLLGARRIMNVLNDSIDAASQRPMREARKRRVTRDRENEDPLSSTANGPSSPTLNQLGEMLQLEVCHHVPCLLSEVDCVRNPSVGSSLKDPCSVQGERISTQSIEIDPNYVYTKNSDSDSSSESNNDEEDVSVRLQPTPSSQLMVKRRRHRQRISLAHDDEENSESELTEESVGSSLQEEMEETEYVPCSYKRPRGRPRRVSSVRSISSLGVEDRMVASELKESGADHGVAKPPLEQRRHVSTLFLPNSPLLNENLKTLLAMEPFEKLTQSQKQKLVAHLPDVDQQNGTRVPSDCFSSSFYSSALREWNERLALGMFTAEYKARVRGEEKRKMTLKPEDSWKEQYYERHYGDKVAVSRDDSPPPYFPYTLPDANTQFLTAIVDGYFNTKTDRADTPPFPPPLPPVSVKTPPKTIPNPISLQTMKSPKKPTVKSAVCKPSKSIACQKKPSVKRLKESTKTKPNTMPEKNSPNSPAKKRNSALLAGKNTGKAIAKKSAIKKGLTTPLSPVLMRKLLKSPNPSKDFLTRSPAQISYQEILQNLKAVSNSDPPANPSEVCQITTAAYSPPFHHPHSVFHDHFALLSKEHVPIDFCFRVTSLPFSLPLHYYSACMRGKAIFREHSYAQRMTTPHKSLTLSLPRSLLTNSNGYVCEDPPMVFCSLCRCLYHSNCTDMSLCPTCQQN